MIQEFEMARIDETTYNSNIAKTIFAKYPHMESIFEKIYASVKYGLYNIWETDEKITFYFHQSCQINLSTLIEFEKYGISIQFPDNQKYAYSISINKSEIKKETKKQIV